MYNLEENKKILQHALSRTYRDYIREYHNLKSEVFYKKIYIFLFQLFFIIIKTLFFLIRSLKNKKKNINFDYQKYEWILVNDHFSHVDLFIKGIVENFSIKNSILLISINNKLFPNTHGVKTKIHRIASFSLFDLLNAISFFFKKKKKFQKKGIWRLTMSLKFIFEIARNLKTIKFYQKIKFSKKAKLITISDSFWHQSILTSEFNKRGLKTLTFIHGSPSQWEAYSDSHSNYILSWGPKMTQKFLENSNFLGDQVIEIGNPKYLNSLKDFNLSDYSFNSINEIVFISPGQILRDNLEIAYGLEELKEDIIKFSNLNLPNFKLSIRPRPDNEEEKFINKIIFKNNLSNKVSIQNVKEFHKLVNKKRIFIASISSVIADILILNGLFIGLDEKMPKNILKNSITYNPELYFDFENIEKFISNLKHDNTFNDYLTKISITRQSLFTDPPTKIDIHIKKIINQNTIF